MKRWKYTLVAGKNLREAIHYDSNVETLLALKKCYEEIHKVIPKLYDEDELKK